MLGIVFAVSANFVFAVSNVFFRKTEHDTSPSMINLFRTSVGVLSFILIAFFTNSISIVFLIPLDLIGLLILSSLLGQVMGDTSYFFSQKYIGPTKALTISLTYPFFTILIDIFFLNASFNAFILLSAVIISVGVGLIAYSKEKKAERRPKSPNQTEQPHISSRKDTALGIIFAFLASISWAIGITITDLSMSKINDLFETERLTSVVGSLIRFPIAAIVLLVINYSLYGLIKRKNQGKIELRIHLTYQIRGRSIHSWLWLIAGALIGTSLGAYLFTEAAYLAGAVTMAILVSTGPLFTLILNLIINKERITILGFIGVLTTLLGIIIISLF
ncbi:MAG: DMT family transporter [Candidatus Lokiarchaeota archaeon]|nr:DMT family transporter [Candidatus Lokiarchaeota archaeon]